MEKMEVDDVNSKHTGWKRKCPTPNGKTTKKLRPNEKMCDDEQYDKDEEAILEELRQINLQGSVRDADENIASRPRCSAPHPLTPAPWPPVPSSSVPLSPENESKTSQVKQTPKLPYSNHLARIAQRRKGSRSPVRQNSLWDRHNYRMLLPKSPK